MPKRSEIELEPDDILLADVPDELIAARAARAALRNLSFSTDVPEPIADHVDVPQDAIASATVMVLDFE